jgi:hypothetical protein
MQLGSLLSVLAFVSGCTTSRSSQINTPLVNLPNGGQIVIQTIQTTGNEMGPGKGPLAVWKQPDNQQKLLITLIPAPGSPTGVLRIDSSTPHYSSDGNRVWLVRDGQSVASFDYVSGVAILGPDGQPDWANPNTGSTSASQTPEVSDTQASPQAPAPQNGR